PFVRLQRGQRLTLWYIGKRKQGFLRHHAIPQCTFLTPVGNRGITPCVCVKDPSRSRGVIPTAGGLYMHKGTVFCRNIRRHIQRYWILRRMCRSLSCSASQGRRSDVVATVFRRVMRVVLLVAAVVPAIAQGQEIKVTLLGTGCPPPVMHRFGPSILVEAGEQKLLFDAGRGALQRLTQLKVRWQDVQGVFLTHLHSDHVVGFPDLWLTGWLVGPGRNVPLQVWGPRGTKKMMSHLEQAYEYDIRIRLYDDRASPDGVVILRRGYR